MNKNTKQKNKQELDILKAYKKGELETISNLNKVKKEYSQIARNTLKKNKSITIRLAERDLLRLKAKAFQEGIPYQTLLTSIIHKNV
jgi:predicted DNA binding CopG/RHH family protein